MVMAKVQEPFEGRTAIWPRMHGQTKSQLQVSKYWPLMFHDGAAMSPPIRPAESAVTEAPSLARVESGDGQVPRGFHGNLCRQTSQFEGNRNRFAHAGQHKHAVARGTTVGRRSNCPKTRARDVVDAGQIQDNPNVALIDGVGEGVAQGC